ncbi:MAG: hypothetical protein HY905_25880 [Deltaproteobacteria bacterium]|nr:hypothetical protein [Deltaproteobacteria bacterium]
MKLLVPALVGFALCVGCASEIGDECSANVDCSVNGDRACDTSVPGGYCTILDCRAGTCPEEAICVAWGDGVGERTFCMRHCGDDSDCRGGYRCYDPGRYAADHAGDSTFRASDYGVILDLSPGEPRFCTLNW